MYEPLLSGRVPINVSTVCTCTSSASDGAPSPPSCSRAVPRSRYAAMLGVLASGDGITPQRALGGRAVARLSNANSARSILTLCSACRRTMRGRIFESKNMALIGVDSATSACDSPAGRGCAREAVARARARSAFKRYSSARVDPGAQGMFSRAVVRGWGRPGQRACWLCHVRGLRLRHRAPFGLRRRAD